MQILKTVYETRGRSLWELLVLGEPVLEIRPACEIQEFYTERL
jgi:hypothetical protein